MLLKSIAFAVVGLALATNAQRAPERPRETIYVDRNGQRVDRPREAPQQASGGSGDRYPPYPEPRYPEATRVSHEESDSTFTADPGHFSAQSHAQSHVQNRDIQSHLA
jgi:hypothetical protein